MVLKKEDLIQFMQNDLGVDISDIEESTLLFSSRIIDSFSLVSMLTYIEKSCGIRINPVDVNLDNMDSIERILKYVATKVAS